MKNRKETFWVVVSEHKTFNYIMEESFSSLKKDSVKKAIVALCSRMGSCQRRITYMNQPIYKSWKEIKKDGYYAKKIHIIV